ncbi:hypothetical protein [Vibrio crassostreae]|uniref:hypothetical protein n=1 Tax=Vibrio crassostreae TaxID=246167 RepID=UPI001B3034F7|nr:hypothetical protein [Vibrio crassostreae]
MSEITRTNLIATLEAAIKREPHLAKIAESHLHPEAADLGLKGCLLAMAEATEHKSINEVEPTWFIITEDMCENLTAPDAYIQNGTVAAWHKTNPVKVKPTVLQLAEERMTGVQYNYWFEGNALTHAAISTPLSRKEFPIKIMLSNELGEDVMPQEWHDRQSHMRQQRKMFGSSMIQRSM